MCRSNSILDVITTAICSCRATEAPAQLGGGGEKCIQTNKLNFYYRTVLEIASL